MAILGTYDLLSLNCMFPTRKKWNQQKSKGLPLAESDDPY